MIKHDLRVGETIEIGETRITLRQKAGKRVTLIIDAPDHVKVKFEAKNNEQEGADSLQETV